MVSNVQNFQAWWARTRLSSKRQAGQRVGTTENDQPLGTEEFPRFWAQTHLIGMVELYVQTTWAMKKLTPSCLGYIGNDYYYTAICGDYNKLPWNKDPFLNDQYDGTPGSSSHFFCWKSWPLLTTATFFGTCASRYSHLLSRCLCKFVWDLEVHQWNIVNLAILLNVTFWGCWKSDPFRG